MTQKNVKFLHLMGSFDQGGKEARIASLMNFFGKTASHLVISADDNAYGAKKWVNHGVKVQYAKDGSLLKGGFSVKRYRQLAEIMRKYDCVMTYNWGGIDGAMAHTFFSAQLGLPPLIHHEDGFNQDEAKKLKTRRNWTRIFALARSSALVVPSRTLADIARTKWKQPDTRISRITNGIDVAAFGKKAKINAIPNFRRTKNETIIGTVAGLRPVKNLGLLIRATAQLEGNVRLVIVGEGEEREKLQNLAQDIGFADRLVMPGFLPHPENYMGLFDIFALSSDSEQCPISVIEAMAAGLPIATPKCGDIPHMVSLENSDLLVDHMSQDDLTHMLATLISDKKRRDMIAKANKIKAEQDFDQMTMYRRYSRLYSGVMRNQAWLDHINHIHSS